MHLRLQEFEDYRHHSLPRGIAGAGGNGHDRKLELDGQPFTALNGGPIFNFTEAISFVVDCETQEEVDE